MLMRKMVAVTTEGQPDPQHPPDTPGQYEPFFGLHESPFSLAPDPRFLFGSASHTEALAQVGHALERREPLVVITGDIGTGKTLLCRTVLQRLPFKTFLSVIHDPLLDADDLVKELLRDFGVISKDPARFRGASRHELVQTLRAFLTSLTPIQAHAVVMIDEAQHLRPEVLEEIRLLSNIDDTRGTILQIILVGQTDLEPLLSRPDLRQLQQRVSRRFALQPLSRDEIQQYIDHRLTLASQATAPGQETGLAVQFAPDAIQAIAQTSGGVPRVINLLCDRALELAFASRTHVIDAARIREAAGVLGIDMPAFVRPPAEAAAAATPLIVPAIENPPLSIEPPSERPTTLQTRLESLARETPDIPAPESTTPFAQPTGAIEPESEHVPEPASQPGTPTLPRYLTIAALFAVIAATVVFGVLRLRTPAADATPPAPQTTSSPRPAAAQPPRPPSAAAAIPPKDAAAGNTPAAAGATTAPAVTPPAAAQATDPSAPTRFDIVVASFHTEARATSVAGDVTALGLPVRQRAADSWQQVIAGPFNSREEAEQAQQKIHGAGMTGTQIVPATK
jgi:type II secretory pathway predicted ATPase ExeA/cell division protein FtsN